MIFMAPAARAGQTVGLIYLLYEFLHSLKSITLHTKNANTHGDSRESS
jgi:hypothetical protein